MIRMPNVRSVLRSTTAFGNALHLSLRRADPDAARLRAAENRDDPDRRGACA